MKTILCLCSLSFAALMLSACEMGSSKSSVRSALGINRAAPDEFKVVSRPPLSIPPEFNLRPPKPGAPPRGVSTAEEQAAQTLLGQNAPAAAITSGQTGLLDRYRPKAETSVAPVVSRSLESAGEARFLSRAGADQADEDIRSKLYSDADNPPPRAKSQFALQELLGKEESEAIIDPSAEAERIRSNTDADKPVNEGEIKTIEPAPSTLDLLFE